ncbi:hypothetical protein O181_052605 [Austropuccinia psidii MF-1]|uniref:Uncharacterized protein n=1 Tax=Austropuccinia psidii MF-1 TaxID=1389203 RepID=A0A9Q3HST5_9BASI|nr:hypothetical protein [Austropuccinia psidii MF-1]
MGHYELEPGEKKWYGIPHYLHIKSFLGQEKTIELLGGWILFSCKDKVTKIENWLKNQSLFLSIDQKKDLEMTPDLEKEVPVPSNTFKPGPEDQLKGPQRKQRGPKNNQGQGKKKANWHMPHPQGFRMPQLEPSAMKMYSIWPEKLWNLQPRSRKG